MSFFLVLIDELKLASVPFFTSGDWQHFSLAYMLAQPNVQYTKEAREKLLSLCCAVDFNNDHTCRTWYAAVKSMLIHDQQVSALLTFMHTLLNIHIIQNGNC